MIKVDETSVHVEGSITGIVGDFARVMLMMKKIFTDIDDVDDGLYRYVLASMARIPEISNEDQLKTIDDVKKIVKIAAKEHEDGINIRSAGED